MVGFLKKLLSLGAGDSAGEEGALLASPSLSTEEMLARLPFSSRVVKREIALDYVRAAHRARTGQHAFLVCGTKRLDAFLRMTEQAHVPPELVLQGADKLTLEAWLKQLEARMDAGWAVDRPTHGPWPAANDVEPATQFVTEFGLASHGDEWVVAYSPVPGERWWETYAHTGFGGLQDCPPTEVHIMLGRLWAKEYGALLVTHDHDCVELSIARPITERAEAMTMARLHFAYCSDAVLPETLETYAANLIGATAWRFQWG